MLNESDIKVLASRGLTIEQVEKQLDFFKKGFPFLEIISAAKIGDGIVKVSNEEMKVYLNEWDEFLKTDAKVLKFVPASGAASRMFKDLFTFLEGESDLPIGDFEKKFFDEIDNFAFYDDLDKICLTKRSKNIKTLLTEGDYKSVVHLLLSEEGLNYGSLPKGLLKFHRYADEVRTPMQEHLVEGVLYAKSDVGVDIHFTVSKEHNTLFREHLVESLPALIAKYNTTFQVGFSEQKPSTDTIAADKDNQPFRDNGNLLFRPGGHGALIENLDELEQDVIFVKNIDNVVPDSLKDITVDYKKLIAGMLVHLQKQSFAYLKELENEAISDAKLSVIAKFVESKLLVKNPNNNLKNSELRDYLIAKLNRPIRVCGMVKNEGEPGGGPFFVLNSDGTVSLQILESSQIDLSKPVEKEKLETASHFNPVDLVLGVRNYKGEKFALKNYIDHNAGFISLKSFNGQELKALELPGLWNGAMSDWNTIFVEVPIETFNPVKTVNDLLREEHQ